MFDKKFACIGDTDTTLPFKSLGATIITTDNTAATLAALKGLNEEYIAAFITQEAAAPILDEILNIRATSHLALVVIPSLINNHNIDLLKKDIEKAIGTDAIFNK